MKLKDILQTEQQYVLDYIERTGVEIKAVQHEKATTTCFEKADLLGWSPERVVKAIFLNVNGNGYGFVCPELGTRESLLRFDKNLVGKILGLSSKQVKFSSNSCVPTGMEIGTCTPFVLTDSFEDYGLGKELEKIFVYDSGKFNESLVNISIGGFGEEAHKTSLHLYGKDIYECLNYEFPGKIGKFNFENI